MNHLFWAAIEAAASKSFERDALTPGKYEVSLSFSGTIDGKKQPRETVNGTLAIGESSERAKDYAPTAASLVAALLFAMSTQTRRKVLSEIDARTLESDEATMAQAIDLISLGKTSKLQTVRGSISLAKH